MKKPRQVPIFAIVIGILVLNGLTPLDLPLIPIVLGLVVLSVVTGRGGLPTSRRPQGADLGRDAHSQVYGHRDDGHRDDGHHDDGPGMPLIDVPGYHDTASAPPPLPSPGNGPSGESGSPGSGQASEPGPWQTGSAPGPSPSPATSWGATSTPGPAAAYPTSTSTDPVVSLGQLHLGRLARELDAAARTASGADVTRLLGEIDQTVERSLMMLSGAQGGPGSGRKEFESGLRRLARELEAARGEEPAGSRVSRVVQTCSSLGQTGRYA
ncbi:hypothetical protein [Serinicoccus profundi]|uniref:hypothetical protein n=1 Tax=Serinicoccus profundi TaxID=1078471 RepID=UPI000255E87A|nr:hypothetical protein [Serinicoccus profundi]